MKAMLWIGLLMSLTGPFTSAAQWMEEDTPDWLTQNIDTPASIIMDGNSNELRLSNGLLKRVFRIRPNLATLSYQNTITGQELIRGVKPEAAIKINGKHIPIGGLQGQPNYAFLQPDWLDRMETLEGSFQYESHSTGDIQEHISWPRKRHAADLPWPPKGQTVSIHFSSPRPELKDIHISVHYNLYQGLPALCKWITVTNRSASAITIDAVTTEFLALVERESDVERTNTTKPRVNTKLEHNDLAEITFPWLHMQSDFAFCGSSYKSADQTTFWEPDPQYETQVNYSRQWPHLLTSRYPYGPAVELRPGETFTSFRTYELIHDSDDAERRGLAIRRLQRALAPWSSENPLMLHLRYSDSESIRRAVDQCVETGFEMIILSFGSGINMESDDPEYIAQVKKDFDYAHSKGIEIGGYSLLSSRDAGPEHNVIDPKTGKPGAYFGQAPCLMSQWGDLYFENLKNFIIQTGCDLLEHDGSYPGDPCASTTHNGHRGLDDSQYKQYQRITEFYRWCRSKNIYLNVPDYYFLSGSNKTAMGYRETNWSLPRTMQIIHGRQNIYDGTWSKTPSMGWMFVPLVEYQGGGSAATIEPLNEHLDTYEAFLAQNLLSGVQACYRGPRLFDTDETKAVVKRWVDLYKKYRPILESDIIHLRRPDGRDWDGLLHVNPEIDTKGFAVFFNPSNEIMERSISLPLYYTGLSDKATVSRLDGEPVEYTLDRHYNIRLNITIPTHGWVWYTVR